MNFKNVSSPPPPPPPKKKFWRAKTTFFLSEIYQKLYIFISYVRVKSLIKDDKDDVSGFSQPSLPILVIALSQFLFYFWN